MISRRNAFRFAAWGVVACVLATPSVVGAEEATPRWKFHAGDELAYAVTQHATASVINSGLDYDVVQTQVLDTKWTVESVAEDGTAQLVMEISRIQMQMSNPFASHFVFDSNEATSGEGPLWQMVGPLVDATLNQPFRATVSPAGVVSDIQLPESLAAILAHQTDMAAQNLMMGGSFGASAYHEMIEWTFVRLPQSGATQWTWEYAGDIGNLGSLSTTVEFRYDAEDESGDVVQFELDHRSDFELSDDVEGMFYLEVTEQDSHGTVDFSLAEGRMQQGVLEQIMSLEGDVRGNEFFQDRVVKTTIRTGKSDDLPRDEPSE